MFRKPCPFCHTCVASEIIPSLVSINLQTITALTVPTKIAGFYGVGTFSHEPPNDRIIEFEAPFLRTNKHSDTRRVDINTEITVQLVRLGKGEIDNFLFIRFLWKQFAGTDFCMRYLRSLLWERICKPTRD